MHDNPDSRCEASWHDSIPYEDTQETDKIPVRRARLPLGMNSLKTRAIRKPKIDLAARRGNREFRFPARL
jgi:hypothetical protein